MTIENSCHLTGKRWSEAGVRLMAGLGLLLSLTAAAVLELLVMMMAAGLQKGDCRDTLQRVEPPTHPSIAAVRGWKGFVDRVLSSLATGTVWIFILVATVCMALCSCRRMMSEKLAMRETEQ
jgi:hypothetical protein